MQPDPSAARCAAFAIEVGVVIDCVLTHGHDGSHDPGDMTGVRAMSAASNDAQMEPVEAVTAALRAHIDRTRLPITEDYADIAAHVALKAAADWLADRAANPVEPDEWGIHSSGMRHAANLLDGGDRDENA